MKNIIKKVWNYEKMNLEVPVSLRKKALRWLAGFLILMLLMTALSRAANAFTLPQVKVATPQKRSIGQVIQAEGRLEAGEEEAIFTMEGLRIAKVFVQSGQTVKKGAPLVQLDQVDLEKKITQTKRDIAAIDLSIEDANYNQEVQEENRSRGIQQAHDDYNATKDSEDRKVDQAYQAVMDVEQALEQAEASPAATEEEQAALMEQLWADYETKKSAYEGAVIGRDEVLFQKDMAIENAQSKPEKSSAPESEGLKRESLSDTLKQYEDLKEKGGMITASQDGTITTVGEGIVSGGMTSATSLMQFITAKEKLRFVTRITKEEQKHLALGDEVVLSKVDEEVTSVEGLTVDSISQNAENPEQYDVTVLCEGDDFSLYETATMEVKGNTTNYSDCIENSALRKGNDEREFVLVLTEKETILGTQLVAEELNVTVLDNNASYAAIQEGILTPGQSIIISSNKEVRAGDRVRLVEDEE